MFEYKATVLKVHDGDSALARVDLGFRVSVEIPIRLLGLDAPELNGPTEEERKAAVLARSYLKGLVEGKEVRLQTSKGTEKYGRWLANMWVLGLGLQEKSVNQQMLESGYGRKYDGGRRGPWQP